jgi:hypothetical protein
LVERIRQTLGSSPYEPVTMDPDEAADLLATVMGTPVTREEGPLSACSCPDLRELKGRKADDYADNHLAYVGLGPWDLDNQALFRCPVTGIEWVMTYPGPTPHGYHEPLLVRGP